MIALALEFSSAHRSAAVLDLASPVRLLAFERETGERTLPPLPLIMRTLAGARMEREAVRCIVVGLGPGSYTGIRGAIAIAQGWQLARGVKLLGISSLEALAWQARHLGRTGDIWVVIDAHRGEFYRARYRITATGRECLEPPRVASRSEILTGLDTAPGLLGPGLSRWFPQADDLEPTAEAVGFLAAGRMDFVPGENLEPIYLRETSFVKAPLPRKF